MHPLDAQAIFYNIKNFLTFQLSTAVAALSIVAVATFLGFKCPINAMQVGSNTCLWGSFLFCPCWFLKSPSVAAGLYR